MRRFGCFATYFQNYRVCGRPPAVMVSCTLKEASPPTSDKDANMAERRPKGGARRTERGRRPNEGEGIYRVGDVRSMQR